MAFLSILKAKVHGARVTESRFDYDGSITIGEEIMDAAGIMPGEKVLVANLTKGSRFETYAIKGSERTICVNGAASHLASAGDVLIIMNFKLVNEDEAASHKPRLVYLDEENRIVRIKEELPEEKSVCPNL